MDTTFTTEMVRAMFGPNIAPIIATYKCSYKKVSGRLYIASNAVCFYSNLFGFERKLLIRIVDITIAGLTRSTSIIIRSNCLKSTTSTTSGGGGTVVSSCSSTNAVAGSMALSNVDNGIHGGQLENSTPFLQEHANTSLSSNEEELQQEEQQQLAGNDNHEVIIEEEHVFKSFQDRESVLQVILGLMGKKNDDIALEPNDCIGGTTTTTSSNRLDMVHDNNTMTLTERLFDHREPILQQQEQQLQTSLRLRTYSDPRDDHNNNNNSVSNHSNTVPKRSRVSSTPNWLKSKDSSRRMKKTTFNVSSSGSEQYAIPTLEEMKINFASNDNYPETIIQSYPIPNLSIEEFYKHFLHDDAKWSFQTFQQEVIKDENIQITPWKENDDNKNNNIHDDNSNNATNKALPLSSSQQQSRSMSFIHPRNAKLGPSTALTRKEQICTLYQPSHGIVLYSKTDFDGIPYSDCFVVEEKWIVEPLLQQQQQEQEQRRQTKICNASSNGCQLSIKFKVNFTKSTMMKKIIYSQTKQEIKDWFGLYMKYLESCVGNESSIPPMNNTAKYNTMYSDKFDVLYLIFGRVLISLLVSGGIYYIYTLHLRISMLEVQVENLINQLHKDI